MVISNRERIAKALDPLRDGLRPKCEQRWQQFYGDDWLNRVNGLRKEPMSAPNTGDVAFLLIGIKLTWYKCFSKDFAPAIKSLVHEVATARNNWAHQEPFSSDETDRALDSMELLLKAFGNRASRHVIRDLKRDLRLQVAEEESRAERRKVGRQPTAGKPQKWLSPWRELIHPHSDVAAGTFNQAEFAADLFEVAHGEADREYRDPKEFFARTYLTVGLEEMLVGAAKRLAGNGDDPVIQLQTNFGGGKTHSMIALYHLAAGGAVNELPGVAEALTAADVKLPAKINRAVIVGQQISPGAPEPRSDGVILHTLWGHLAYQLGGKEAYELVRADDEAGTNPGAALGKLFKEYGPAVVLIDEWVAYARQLPRDGERLAGGDFATQFTFAQALTEAVAAANNVVLLVAIPESDIEVGGEQGRKALEELQNVVARKASHWQPATPDESFEIVRRRLFDAIPADKVKVRDVVIDAFHVMYRGHKGVFPSAAAEADYLERMKRSYPIHPELFDRLFGDWSTLDTFQRTRGVLRFMALAISELWESGDKSLMIMPGNLPMHSGVFVSEMRNYLEDGWDPIIKTEVDGADSRPMKLDKANKAFGELHATRRAARTVYMGSAPHPDDAPGVDVKSVALGCAQPGESVKQFRDALKHLAGEATYLHVDGTQYLYSLHPTLNRMARDRAESMFSDADADREVKARLTATVGRGNFVGVHVFAAGPGDVPDDDEGVRLVVLAPDATHSTNAGKEKNSNAVKLAKKILADRDKGPRLNRNLVVFVAAHAERLRELRNATRLFLAWQSIADTHDELNLTANRRKQAESRMGEKSQQIDSLIEATFTQILTPTQEPGTDNITWLTTKATASGGLAERVSKKLEGEEKLITVYSGVRVEMDIDRRGLWSENHDLSVGDLWDAYARYPYMPRLARYQTLTAAISDATANLNWATETFGYADVRHEERWVGVKTAQQIRPVRTGLLIHRDHVPPPVVLVPASTPSVSQPVAGGKPLPDKPTKFYAVFALDTLRGIKDLDAIIENVTKQLGSDVELSLEVRAKNPEGYNEKVLRNVAENANVLGASQAEFE